MKTKAEIKLEWQKHNRDNGLSWNEVSELVNQVADAIMEQQPSRIDLDAIEKKIDDALENNPPKPIVTEEEIENMLATYEKEWSNKKGEFLPLNVFQKDKVKGAAKTIIKLIQRDET